MQAKISRLKAENVQLLEDLETQSGKQQKVSTVVRSSDVSGAVSSHCPERAGGLPCKLETAHVVCGTDVYLSATSTLAAAMRSTLSQLVLFG